MGWVIDNMVRRRRSKKVVVIVFGVINFLYVFIVNIIYLI